MLVPVGAATPSWAFFLLFLSLFVRHAVAIFQDEAYNVDFAHTLVGTPIRQSTFFHAPSTGSKATLLYTLSENGVVGAINPRDGELVWRVIANDTISAGNQEQGRGVLRAHETSSTIVSGAGSTIRAWDAKDGRLVWEHTADESVKSLEILTVDGTQADAYIVTEGEASGGTLLRLAGNNGSEKWSVPLAKADYPLGVSASPSKLFVTSLVPKSLGGYKIKVQTIDPATGKELSQNVIDSENDVTSEQSIIHLSGASAAPIIAWRDDKFKNVKLNILGNKQISISIVDPYGTDQIKGIFVHEVPGLNAKPHFLIQYNRIQDHRGEVWHVDVAAGKINKAFAIPQVAGSGAFGAGSDGDDVYFTHQTDTLTTLTKSTSPDTVETWSLTPAKPALHFNREPAFAVSEIAPRSGSHFAVRKAYVDNAGDLNMVQNGAHAWSRHEGLTGVIAAAYADIATQEPLIEALAAETDVNPVAAYVHRVQRHIKDLQQLPNWIANVPSRLISSFTGVTLGDAALASDAFGFSKIVVVATRKGRVAALGSATQGQILWSIQAVEVAAGEEWFIKSVSVTPAGIQVVGFAGELVILDPTSGKVIQQQPQRVELGDSYYVSVASGDGRPGLISVSEKGVPATLPDAFPKNAVLVTKRADGTVAGWKQTANGKTTLAWSFEPKEGETLGSLAARPLHDPVASIGRALGDRNVLYKYLSNNLILVTATSLAASTLSVHLLDTVTGQTLYSTSHNNIDVSSEIPITFSENWFAYSILSDAPSDTPAGGSTSQSSVKAYQLIVSEMFESQIPNDRGPLGPALNYSSFTNLYIPDVRSTAFVLTSPITALTTTSTLQGITPRSLLAYTPALAGLLAIPVPFLSPRRPVNRDPTPAEREEGLPRYHPHLDFAPTWFLSHKRELLGIEGMISTPSQMESTSLVFAYGDLDLFGTRVSPIGTFDVLGKGFGKISLVLTCVALAIGTGLLSPMARRKQIDGLWRS